MAALKSQVTLCICLTLTEQERPKDLGNLKLAQTHWTSGKLREETGLRNHEGCPSLCGQHHPSDVPVAVHHWQKSKFAATVHPNGPETPRLLVGV